MSIAERVLNILEYNNISKSELARRLGEKQPTINRYLTLEHQEKLSPYLWTMLELFPHVSREWLFFGEGEMLSKANPTNAKLDELKAEISELENELKQERQQNRKLTDQLLNNISKESNKNHEQTA